MRRGSRVGQERLVWQRVRMSLLDDLRSNLLTTELCLRFLLGLLHVRVRSQRSRRSLLPLERRRIEPRLRRGLGRRVTNLRIGWAKTVLLI